MVFIKNLNKQKTNKSYTSNTTFLDYSFVRSGNTFTLNSIRMSAKLATSNISHIKLHQWNFLQFPFSKINTSFSHSHSIKYKKLSTQQTQSSQIIKQNWNKNAFPWSSYINVFFEKYNLTLNRIFMFAMACFSCFFIGAKFIRIGPILGSFTCITWSVRGCFQRRI